MILSELVTVLHRCCTVFAGSRALSGAGFDGGCYVS